MKKIVCAVLVLMMALSLMGTSFAEAVQGNYTDEMKIPRAADLSEEDGADAWERLGDHPGSVYFNALDFYNMTSTDTLTILPKFQTIQQSSEWSCGVACAVMVMNHYDLLGDYNEQTLAEFRSVGKTSGVGGAEPSSTSLQQMIDIFDGVGGFTYESTFDLGDKVYEEFNLQTVQDYLKDGVPVMVGWNDWGGHWQVIIGYDTMGTETEQDDVIIVADPYDTSDHNGDGYGVYGAQRFYYNFTFYDFFNEEDGNDMIFLAAKPAE